MSTRSLVSLDVGDDGVAVLTLDNPPLNLNAIQTMREISAACDTIEKDRRVRVLVLTGAGSRAFCVGSDIKEFMAIRNEVVEKKLELENGTFARIEALPIPVIAALNAMTLGGGGEIALACDIRIIASDTRIGFPEIKLGVFPGSGGLYRLPALVGPARALELMYTGDAIDAQTALRIGLVNHVVAPEAVLETALTLARRIARGPALALQVIRAGVHAAANETTAESIERTLHYSDLVFRNPDLDAGLKAFFGKTEPVFARERGTEPLE